MSRIGTIEGKMTFERVVIESAETGFIIRGQYDGETNSTVLEVPPDHLHIGGLSVFGLDGDLVLEPEEPGTPEKWVWAISTGEDLYLEVEKPNE